MGTLKLGKVLECKYQKEWLNPHSKKIIYYHDIVTDMGDSGSVGALDKNSLRIKKGAYIEYEIDENGKIKVHESSADAGSTLAPGSNKLKTTPKESSTTENTKPRIKGQEAFLGYAWSYAKDLVIAGKTMEDVDELNKVARFIYEEIGKMLNNEQ